MRSAVARHVPMETCDRCLRAVLCAALASVLAVAGAWADPGDDGSRSALLIDPVPERTMGPRLIFPGVVTVPTPSVGATFDLESAIEHARRSSSSGVGFYDDYLMPKLRSNFINISTLDLTPLPGRPGVEYSTHLAVVEAAETCAERSARHAIRGYLLDRTGLEERSERIKEELRTDGESSSSGKPEKVDRWSFDVSTAHFLPRVGMRYRVGEHSDVNLMLYGTGSVGLEYLRIRSTYTRVFAGYDSEDDRYDLQLRRSF